MIPKIQLGLYKHYKGNIYRVVAVALHSETKEPLVVYQKPDASEWWVRPYTLFIEFVEQDGVSMPRFTYIEQ